MGGMFNGYSKWILGLIFSLLFGSFSWSTFLYFHRSAQTERIIERLEDKITAEFREHFTDLKRIIEDDRARHSKQ